MRQGVILSVSASFLFSFIYYYSTILKPLTGLEVFVWRIVIGLPVLAVFIHKIKQWPKIWLVSKRMLTDFRFFLWSVLSAVLFGIQTWIFVWAPIHNMALDVSLGYFLLPLMMVLAGRVFYKEKLSWVQQLAVAFAAMGVLHELWRVNSFSWATLVVALGYPPYFMLRRYLQVGTLPSLWFDFCFLLIPVGYVLFTQENNLLELFAESPRFYWQVPFFGMVSAVALLGYLAASRLLPLGLFGLLGYVEPVLLFWVAFLLLGEPIAAAQWWSYIPIWIAVGLVALEGVWALRREGAVQEDN